MIRVKFCGLTRPEDILAANALTPAYVGFVFAKSPRRVQPLQAARLKALLSPGIQAVGVFVNAPPGFVAGLCKNRVIDLVQLHGDESESYIKALKNLTDAPLIKALPVRESLPALPPGAAYPLFDTKGQSRGGGGRPFNWELLQTYTQYPYFLAGGLNAENVADALARLSPFALDVSSGVETDGKKDPAKMADFMRAVQAAEPALGGRGPIKEGERP